MKKVVIYRVSQCERSRSSAVSSIGARRDPDWRFIKGPGSAGFLSENKRVRDEIGSHFIAALDRYVVVRISFSDGPTPALMTTLDREIMQGPKRWLRARAAALKAAGGVMAAAYSPLKIREGGIFGVQGFDLDFHVLVACRPKAVEGVVKALDPAHLKAPHNRWPTSPATVSLLKDRQAVAAAIRNIWDTTLLVDIDPDVVDFFQTVKGRLVAHALSQQACSALKAVGYGGLTCFAGLMRNGSKLVRTGPGHHIQPPSLGVSPMVWVKPDQPSRKEQPMRVGSLAWERRMRQR